MNRGTKIKKVMTSHIKNCLDKNHKFANLFNEICQFSVGFIENIPIGFLVSDYSLYRHSFLDVEYLYSTKHNG